MRLRDLFPKGRSARSSPPPPVGYGSSGLSYFSFLEIDKNTTAVACTNVIANSIGILPLNLYLRNSADGSRQKAVKHPLYGILRRRPNISESPVTFFEKLVRHILQKGNAYIYKERSGDKLVGLRILNPEQVRESYEGYSVTYLYRGERYTDEDILHIPSLQTDDWGHGTAVVDLARAAVTLGNQLDQASAASFGNGLNSRLFVKIEEALKGINDTSEQQKIIREYADYIARNYAGASNAGKPLIGLNGMEITELKEQSSNAEAQLLESRKWQFTEICKIFGVPPWLIDGTYDVKYGGLEQAMTVFLNFCLMPYLRLLEQKFATLLTPYEQEAYYFEFDFNVLLRPDEKSRAEFYLKLFGMGAISPGGICARENIEPPTEGADARFVPANMMPLRQDVLDAYMATAKQKAADMSAGSPSPVDPSLVAGSQAQ